MNRKEWEENLLSVTEAAELLGVTRQRVQVMLTTGKLEGVKVGKTWIVYRDSVNRRAYQQLRPGSYYTRNQQGRPILCTRISTNNGTE